MRIQILPLPSIVVGDDVQEPFALIIDQWPGDLNPPSSAETELTEEAFNTFAGACGAKAVLFVKDTVEIVDRYAESASDEVAVREFGKLDDFLLLNFGDEPDLYEDNDSAADVAIRLLREVLLHRDAVKVADQTRRLLSDLRTDPKPAEDEAS